MRRAFTCSGWLKRSGCATLWCCPVTTGVRAHARSASGVPTMSAAPRMSNARSLRAARRENSCAMSCLARASRLVCCNDRAMKTPELHRQQIESGRLVFGSLEGREGLDKVHLESWPYCRRDQVTALCAAVGHAEHDVRVDFEPVLHARD